MDKLLMSPQRIVPKNPRKPVLKPKRIIENLNSIMNFFWDFQYNAENYKTFWFREIK